jgi:hypothetical protein
MSIPRSGSLDNNQTYVEALADANTPDSMDLVNPATLDLPADRPSR